MKCFGDIRRWFADRQRTGSPNGTHRARRRPQTMAGQSGGYAASRISGRPSEDRVQAQAVAAAVGLSLA